MKKPIALLFIIVFLSWTCKNAESNKVHKKVKDSIETELLMLKNQAFCNLYNRITKGRICNTEDGSSYIQVSNLGIGYYNNSNLEKIISTWASREYKSHDPSNKLYLMKALDFYNSRDLNNYIDSIRTIEYKKLNENQ